MSRDEHNERSGKQATDQHGRVESGADKHGELAKGPMAPTGDDAFDPNLPHPQHPISLEWPASIAVIGAGPLGLEAAIYGRFLGYQVTVLERGPVAANVLDWQHVKMFTPFSMLHSKIGRSAIIAQNPQHLFPADDQIVSGQQWRDQYLLPLAETDLLQPFIQTGAEVLSVARSRYRKHRQIGTALRTLDAFTVVWQNEEGREQSDEFDFVIDASGSYGNSNGLGPGGGLAVGERHLCSGQQAGFTCRIPDFQQNVQQWQGRSTLLIGDGFSAATSVLGLQQVLEQAAPEMQRSSQVLWISNKTVGANGPLPQYPADPLIRRQELSEKVNQVAIRHRRESPQDLQPGFNFVANANVMAVAWDEHQKKFRVHLRTWQEVDWSAVHEDEFEEPDDQDFELMFDQIVVNTGYRGQCDLFRELQVHQCYASEGPMALAASLIGASGDCLALPAMALTAGRTTEGRFFIVGIKSYGRLSSFLYKNGLDQVRDAFRWIVGRVDLDLNQTVQV